MIDDIVKVLLLKAYANGVYDGIKEHKKQLDNWISVTKRKPKNNSLVFMKTCDGEKIVGFFSDKVFKIYGGYQYLPMKQKEVVSWKYIE